MGLKTFKSYTKSTRGTVLVSKNNLWNILKDYYGRYEASNIMPETYIPTVASDIILFKKNYSSQKIYILKKNLQRKLGIKLMRNNNNIIDYCKKNNFVLIQEYIQNPFLVNGYKVNLRLFMFFLFDSISISADNVVSKSDAVTFNRFFEMSKRK